MAARSSLFSARRLAGTALAGLLVAAAAVTASPPPARAADGATGLHTGMMPPDSPDAVTTSAGRQAADVTVESTQPTGVDVSHWQHDRGPLNWSQVAASGQKFAIMKATELYTDNGQPLLFTDPYLHSDLTAAHAAGLVVGAYAFAHPENSPTAQADAFANAIGTLPPGSLPPVLDLEVTGGLNPTQLVSWTHSFLDRLQARTNIVPMIYSSPLWWQSAMGGSTAFGNYPLWEAHYTTASAPYTMGGWSSYTLWQFTSTGTVPGITGAVDRDRFNSNAATSLSSVAQAVHPTTVNAPARFAAGDSLESANLQYTLTMQGDGNLVEYSNGRPLWNTRTGGNSGAWLNVQKDGNLVLYSKTLTPLWTSRTNSYGAGAQLALGNDGALTLRFQGQVGWSNGAPGTGQLNAPATLIAGQYLHTPANTGLLVMQSDGNLVLYRYGKPRWASGTNRYPGSRLIVQSDGNLVVYDGALVPRWTSRTAGKGGTRLNLQGDGNLVLYSHTGAVWATGTNH